MLFRSVPATRGTTAVKAKALYDVLANDYSAVQKNVQNVALDQKNLAAAHAALNEYYQ